MVYAFVGLVSEFRSLFSLNLLILVGDAFFEVYTLGNNLNFFTKRDHVHRLRVLMSFWR